MRAIYWLQNNSFQLIKFSAIILALLLVYGYMMREDYDDEDSVTFTFSCTAVLNNRSGYPPEVIKACEDMRNQ